MKISSISNGVVLPANVQAVAVISGGGRPAQTQEVTVGSEEPEPAGHGTMAAGIEASIEPVVNGDGLGLRFYQDRRAGVRVIQVVDLETGDIIRQIPPEEVVNFMRHFQEAKGHFISQRY
jgi:flagellar protein FlaG